MTILKTIDGDEIDTEKIPQGFGSFTKYVQENYDKNWGKHTEAKNRFNVKLTARKSVSVYTNITVEAETQKQAEEKALKQASNQSSMDWDENLDDDIYDIEVEEVEEAEDDDE